MQISALRLVSMPALLVALSGCTAFPTYKPAANEITTPLKVSGWGVITFRTCSQLDKDRVELDVDRTTLTAQIPTGSCLMMNAFRSSGGYQVIHYCNARIAFDPQPQTTYVLNSGMVDQGRCFIELVREDLSTETGVVMEPSVKRAW